MNKNARHAKKGAYANQCHSLISFR